MTDPEAMDRQVWICPVCGMASAALDLCNGRPDRRHTTKKCNPYVPAAAREENARLTKAGDLLQSSASRLAEWVNQQDAPPYEVRMAALEGEDAVKDWTAARAALDTTGEGGDH